MSRVDGTRRCGGGLIVWLARALATPYFRIGHGFTWSGAENVPAGGPVIFAANHQSFYDPFLIGLPLRRPVAFLAWDYYCKKPLLGDAMKALGAVPVDVDAPAPRAIAHLLRVLERGGQCCVFPEGKRSRDGGLLEPMPGGGRCRPGAHQAAQGHGC